MESSTKSRILRDKSCGCISVVGPGQYRNAVASGHNLAGDLEALYNPTLPRNGTDPVQVQLNVIIKTMPAG
jgi:hypothetical protein